MNFKFVDVKAQAFDRDTGKEVAASRVERVDVSKNVLFQSAKSVLDIKAIYESFWNNNSASDEVVFVQSITIVTDAVLAKEKKAAESKAVFKAAVDG